MVPKTVNSRLRHGYCHAASSVDLGLCPIVWFVFRSNVGVDFLDQLLHRLADALRDIPRKANVMPSLQLGNIDLKLIAINRDFHAETRQKRNGNTLIGVQVLRHGHEGAFTKNLEWFLCLHDRPFALKPERKARVWRYL
jgi:hypothetical protein